LKRDREKWESRYSARDRNAVGPDPFLAAHSDLLTGGRALDLASGLGGNALFAAQRGYRVHAVDISVNALSILQQEARRRKLDLCCIAADVDHFALPTGLYDLVMVFHFFSVPLMKSIQECLKDGGLLFYATFNHRHTSVKPGFNPKYLVPPGGLARFFLELEILVDEPDAGRGANLSRLIARKRDSEVAL